MKFLGLLGHFKQWFGGHAPPDGMPGAGREGGEPAPDHAGADTDAETWNDIAAAEQLEWQELVASARRQRQRHRSGRRPIEKRRRVTARG
jgi:hypothetical protein